MEQKNVHTQEKDQEYTFRKLPKNIRQIGLPQQQKKVYIEDYVMTYLKQTYEDLDSSRVIVLLGKKGIEEAKDGMFIYGAIALDKSITLEDGPFSQKDWSEIYEKMRVHFPGSQVLGWACGVSLWNSEADSKVKEIQKQQFSDKPGILLLDDVLEKEEKMLESVSDDLQELSGYYIYFTKNTQMQEYMLFERKPRSIDADYEDAVTTNMRQVITEKEESKRRGQYTFYGLVMASVLVLLFSGSMILQSTHKINEMEKTVSRLSLSVKEKQKEVETMANATKSMKKAVTKKEEAAAKKEKKRKSKQTAAKAGSNKSVPQQSTAKPKDSVTQSKIKATSNKIKTSVMGQTQCYVVKKGDTLSQIVWRQYHSFVHMKDVKRKNHISNKNKIFQGECIYLPNYK